MSFRADCFFTNSGTIDVETNSVLTLSNAFNGPPQVFADGTTFSGSGKTVLAPANDGGIFSCSGTITVNGTLQLELTLIRGGDLSIWTGPGLLLFDDSEIDNFTFATNFHAVVSGFEPSFPVGTCTNFGTIYMTNGTLEPDAGAFYNYGTIQAVGDCGFESGFTPLPIGSVQNSGTIIIPPGLNSNSLAINCNFTNYGAIAVGTNSELTVSNDINGAQAYFDGTIFDGAGTIDFEGPSSDNLANLTFGGVYTVNGTVVVNSVSVSGPSTWTGSGSLRWLSANLTSFTFTTNFHVEIGGSDRKSFTGSCTNLGTINWTGSGALELGSIVGSVFYNYGRVQIETTLLSSMIKYPLAPAVCRTRGRL